MMPVKTTLIAIGAAVAFSASILVAASPCARAAGAPDQSIKFFERSIHGSYKRAPQQLMDRSSGAKSIARRSLTVTATGRASTPGGYLVRRVAARYRALAKWRIIAGNSYGPGATRWTLATNKSVNCTQTNATVSCNVSARPANLLQRLGLTDY